MYILLALSGVGGLPPWGQKHRDVPGITLSLTLELRPGASSARRYPPPGRAVGVQDGGNKRVAEKGSERDNLSWRIVDEGERPSGDWFVEKMICDRGLHVQLDEDIASVK